MLPPRRASRAHHATLILLFTLFVAGCDSLTGPAHPDSITVNVTGLPADVTAPVSMTGPNGFEDDLPDGGRLENLTAGTYTVTAHEAHYTDTPFTPESATRELTLTPGGAATARFTYAPHRERSDAALARLNEIRAAAGVEPVALDANGSLGQWLHARYIAENNTRGHDEDPANEWYTAEGAAAGQRSNVSGSGVDRRDEPEWIVSTYFNAPFHLMSMLSPSATSIRVGFHFAPDSCEGCYDQRSASALQIIQDGTWPDGQVVRFPGPDQVIDKYAASGGEYPSPVASCPGYGADEPAGLPIIAMYGRSNTPTVTSTSIEQAGAPVEHCVYTHRTYTNADADAQALARNLLEAYGAVILVPRHELEPSASYRVAIDTTGDSISWGFQTDELPVGWSTHEPPVDTVD